MRGRNHKPIREGIPQRHESDSVKAGMRPIFAEVSAESGVTGLRNVEGAERRVKGSITGADAHWEAG